MHADDKEETHVFNKLILVLPALLQDLLSAHNKHHKGKAFSIHK